MSYYDYDDSSYESEIKFDDIIGDMEIYRISDSISDEFNFARKRLYNGYISNLEYDTYTKMMSEFCYEYVQIRINEFDKWFKNY